MNSPEGGEEMSPEYVWEEHSDRGKSKYRGPKTGVCQLKERCGYSQVGTERAAGGVSEVVGLDVRSLPR